MTTTATPKTAPVQPLVPYHTADAHPASMTSDPWALAEGSMTCGVCAGLIRPDQT